MAVHRVVAAARVGAVHDVVVHERKRVHELERRGDVGRDAVVGVAARADEGAVTERGAQTLAADLDERAQHVDRLRERGVDGLPARELAVEKAANSFFDPRRERERGTRGTSRPAAPSASCKKH